jgi:hypothetical protein
VENKSDPCLLSDWNVKEVVLISIYLYDCLIIGREERIQWLTFELKRNSFNLNVEKNLKDSLIFHIIIDKEMNQIMILQPHSINNLRDKFGNEVLEKRADRTPGTPRFKIRN